MSSLAVINSRKVFVAIFVIFAAVLTVDVYYAEFLFPRARATLHNSFKAIRYYFPQSIEGKFEEFEAPSPEGPILCYNHSHGYSDPFVVEEDEWADWEEEMQFQNELTAGEEVKLSGSDLILDTPGCKLHRTPAFYKGYKRSLNRKPNCRGAGVVSTLSEDEQTLILGKEFRNYGNCNVAEVLRKEGSDSKIVLSKPEPIMDKLNVSDKEILVTRCGKYLNLEARFPVTPAVQDKIDYWKDKELPINVIFFGFDTTSRAHFLRSLPKSMAQAKQMGFLDFKGYHSVAPYTLENMVSFIVGLRMQVVRATCASSWGSKWDNCPSIFNEYNFNKYVTMYAEDGSQTFNWGGQGGFKKRPTDYYLHPLFLARSLRKENPIIGIENNCVNWMNAQSWLLNYVKRFYTHFANLHVPFFAFKWNNDATHDSRSTLAGMDDEILDLLQTLNVKKEVLRRTMIVIVSDHGSRYGDVTAISRPGAFLERLLPGFFIRFPEVLHEKYPSLHLRDVMKLNTRRLTTAFEINHTFKHLLVLQGMSLSNNLTISTFEPVQADRQSLLVPISDSRACSHTNIYVGVCVCNTTEESSAWDNPYIQHKLINFAFKELNGIIQNSQYKDMCKKYSVPMITFKSASVLVNSTNFTEGVIRFIASPGSTVFETRLRVVHENSTLDHVERTGDFVRITPYGDTSWCVQFETDADHMFKELCTCKSKFDIEKLQKNVAHKMSTRATGSTTVLQRT